MRLEEVQKLIPELDWIQCPELKRKTAQLLCKAMTGGEWNFENINRSPVTLLRSTDISSIEHLRDVVQACHMLYPMAKKYCSRHHVAFDYDSVICGALLHDVGKYVEVSADKDGNPHYSPQAKLMRHPLAGAIMAAEQGFPNKIVHIIATHSFEGEQSYQTAESQFVRKIDDLVFQTSVYGIASDHSIENEISIDQEDGSLPNCGQG